MNILPPVKRSLDSNRVSSLKVHEPYVVQRSLFFPSIMDINKEFRHSFDSRFIEAKSVTWVQENVIWRVN